MVQSLGLKQTILALLLWTLSPPQNSDFHQFFISGSLTSVHWNKGSRTNNDWKSTCETCWNIFPIRWVKEHELQKQLFRIVLWLAPQLNASTWIPKPLCLLLSLPKGAGKAKISYCSRIPCSWAGHKIQFCNQWNLNQIWSNSRYGGREVGVSPRRPSFLSCTS